MALGAPPWKVIVSVLYPAARTGILTGLLLGVARISGETAPLLTAALERIGDYATNVAKRSIVLSQIWLPFSLSGVTHMTRLVQENLKLVVDAVGESDAEKAMQVWRSDEAVDDIYNAIFRELVTYMMEDPRNITPCTHLLFIAKNLERIGDHATNIAEMVHYAVTGEPLVEKRPKGVTSAYAVVRPRT